MGTSVPAPLQVPVPSDLSDEAACQALVNPVTAIGLFEIINAPKGGSGRVYAHQDTLLHTQSRAEDTRDMI